MAGVPYRFENASPPLTDTDFDAEKVNENNDAITSGEAMEDGSVKNRHLDSSQLLGVYVIEKFIISDNLDDDPASLGLVENGLVAVNDISQEGGKLYIVVDTDGVLSFIIFKNRILNMTVHNKDDGKKYRLSLNDVQEYTWYTEPVMDDEIVSADNTWSAQQIIEFTGSSSNGIPFVDTIVTVASQATYSLTHLPVSAFPVRAELNGIGVPFSLLGSDITLTELPPALIDWPVGWKLKVYYSIVAATEFVLAKNPTVAISNSPGDVAWANPGNIFASDDSKANTGLIPSGGLSEYLQPTGFGFNLDSVAIIKGIEVLIERSCDADGLAKDDTVQLMKAGTRVGDNKLNVNNWSTAGDEIITYGGPTDLWGTTWLYSDINNANFGVALKAFLSDIGAGTDAYIDHVQIKVYYNFGGV